MAFERTKYDLTRQEFKFFMNSRDCDRLAEGLRRLMSIDPHCIDGNSYTISSVYFDSLTDDDLSEKLEGVRYREKYRVRVYNGDTSVGKFEIKRKLENVVQKVDLTLERDDIASLLRGDFSKLDSNSQFAYVSKRMHYKHYRAKSLVAYDRLAFYLPFNNIRITLDLNLRALGHFHNVQQLQNTSGGMLLMPDGYQILELKYTGNLPDFIYKYLSLFTMTRASISKYASSRIYSNTEIHGDEPILPY